MKGAFEKEIDFLAINTLRCLSIDAVEKAKSGHPGLPLGGAPMAYVLWQYFLKTCGSQAQWPDRDRFILSAGHGSMLLYSLLHLYGFDLRLDELQAFRQWGSRTPGHPEFGLTPGVECTTGPLGQGAANAVGFAIAERKLASLFNRPGFDLVNHHTYAFVSDGDLMEGVCAEACSLAGQLRLGKLIYLYDSNDVTLDGPTSLTFSNEDVAKRFESYDWQVLKVENGDKDLKSIFSALEKARANTEQPTLIEVKTTIGFGSPHKAGTSEAHGSPLGVEEVALTKKTLGWDPQKQFFIPDPVHAHVGAAIHRGEKEFQEWKSLWLRYEKEFPDLARDFETAVTGKLPQGCFRDIPEYGATTKMPTRKASGEVLNKISEKIPWLFGGDADLGVSTNTVLKGKGSFEGVCGTGSNIHFGVREHAMASIANGICYHGGLRIFVATFFCFADYMRPGLRLAAMNHLNPIYVWTHDSIGLGEDGPTHQPIEHLMSLRCMPNFVLIRPCDAQETAVAWRAALESTQRPVGLVLTRQDTVSMPRTENTSAEHLLKGAYTIGEFSGKTHEGHPFLILGTGSEVSVALAVGALLEKKGYASRIISFPSFEFFREQPMQYQDKVLPPQNPYRISIEAGAISGWHEWIGSRGLAIGLERFGASAPASENFKHLGFAPDEIVEKILAKYVP